MPAMWELMGVAKGPQTPDGHDDQDKVLITIMTMMMDSAQ